MPNELWTGGTPAVAVQEGVERRLVMSKLAGGPPMVALTAEDIRSLHAYLGRYLWDLDEGARRLRIASCASPM